MDANGNQYPRYDAYVAQDVPPAQGFAHGFGQPTYGGYGNWGVFGPAWGGYAVNGPFFTPGYGPMYGGTPMLRYPMVQDAYGPVGQWAAPPCFCGMVCPHHVHNGVVRPAQDPYQAYHATNAPARPHATANLPNGPQATVNLANGSQATAHLANGPQQGGNLAPGPRQPTNLPYGPQQAPIFPPVPQHLPAFFRPGPPAPPGYQPLATFRQHHFEARQPWIAPVRPAGPQTFDHAADVPHGSHTIANVPRNAWPPVVQQPVGPLPQPVEPVPPVRLAPAPLLNWPAPNGRTGLRTPDEDERDSTLGNRSV